MAKSLIKIHLFQDVRTAGVSYSEVDMAPDIKYSISLLGNPEQAHSTAVSSSLRDNSNTPGTSSGGEIASSFKKPLKCDKCDKIFFTKFGFSLHSKKHENVFRFVCEVCGKGYNQSVQFRFHCNSHRNMNSDSCPHCKKVFIGHCSLKRHLSYCQANPEAIKQAEYFCHECSKEFRSKDALAAHFSGKHGPKKYSCERCEKTFSWRSSLKAHRKSCLPNK